jgi:predicted aspartyl protease
VIKPATNNKLEYCEAKDVLWDTGATNTIISRNIADALGLEPIQKAMIAGIGGNVEAYTYKISLYFAKEGAWIKDLEVLACDLEDNDIIIGMDTITQET